jgi:hypothetical protein
MRRSTCPFCSATVNTVRSDDRGCPSHECVGCTRCRTRRRGSESDAWVLQPTGRLRSLELRSMRSDTNRPLPESFQERARAEAALEKSARCKSNTRLHLDRGPVRTTPAKSVAADSATRDHVHSRLVTGVLVAAGMRSLAWAALGADNSTQPMQQTHARTSSTIWRRNSGA